MLALALTLLLLSGFATSFYDYTPETFPDSIEQPGLCGMQEPSFLCDPSSLLSSGNLTANHLQLSAELLEVREQTKCTCSPMDNGQCDDTPRGFTISVALIKKMVLDPIRTTEMVRLAAEKFADTLRQRQNRGQCDDDVLIFVSTDDNVTWTSLGAVTQRYLTDDVVTAVSNEAESYFKKGDYTNGILYMVRSYTTLLKGGSINFNNDKWNFPVPLWAIIVICGILVLLLMAVIGFMTYQVVIYCKGSKRAEYTMGTRM